MKRSLSIILMAILVLLSGCSGGDIPDKLDYEIEAFEFTNQDGETVSLEDLKGKVWVADFVFTSCDDVCLPMTFNMSKIQDLVKEEGLENVEFVSFSVDPEVDQPQVLKEFGEKFGADFANWNFLTGYSQDKIELFARESFTTLVVKPEEGDQVAHGTSFYLVDQTGTVVKDYSGVTDVPYETIIEHIKILQQ
ncbi:protein SCO1/2 [Bacillus oleivorans]|uniref:Protein SCO1/2 n=1 Tax=Bacillus oleivorans TaxID=1448271 RepID=A0A285CL64_9BACI|nr:SCO family protein [Bacillus oleivorans]SNX68290.1 protein SCO1/2 [Bacillus oleivorans]